MRRYAILLLLLLIHPLQGRVWQSLNSADSLSIGDSFELIIETDFKIHDIIVPDSLKHFRILTRDIQDSHEGSRASLRIAVLNVGALSFPKLGLQDPDGEAGSTDAFRVHVLATRAESDSLLRDIKAPQRYPWELPFWLYLVIALVIVALAMYLLITALNKPQPKEPAKPAVIKPSAPPVPAWKKALAKLEELRRSNLAERDILSYHYRLSAILREYLEESYKFNALEMTTGEIRQILRHQPLVQAGDTIDILEYCDGVKYAKGQPSTEQIILQTQALQLYLLKQGELEAESARQLNSGQGRDGGI
jgi:hypothetical protein